MSTSTGKRLFGRMWDLTLSTDQPGVPTATAINLSEFHIQFSVEMMAMQVPWRLTATVINPPDELANQIITQATKVSLYGGYLSAQYGHLFSGTCVYFEKGKTSPTETFLRIHGSTADVAYTQALINQNLQAGYTAQDVVDAVVGALGPYGVTQGTITALAQDKSPRGRTLYGMPREILRDLTQTAKATWWLDDGNRLNIMKEGEPLPGAPIQINILNGMTGIPTWELGRGIKVSCLLNYAVQPGRLIQINNEIVNQISRKLPDDTGGDISQTRGVLQTAPQDFNGIYLVWGVNHAGDNRGNEWHTHITTMPVLNPQEAGPRQPG